MGAGLAGHMMAAGLAGRKDSDHYLVVVAFVAHTMEVDLAAHKMEADLAAHTMAAAAVAHRMVAVSVAEEPRLALPMLVPIAVVDNLAKVQANLSTMTTT
jgi:hypothetical protein